MKRNYIFNLILTVSNILFPVISFPYVSKIVGPTGVGKVQFITTYAQYFGLIAALGIPVYGIREVAKRKDNQQQLNQVFSELFVIYFFTSIILSIAYLCTLYYMPDITADRNLYLWSIFLVLMSFTSIDWLFEGLGQFRAVAIRSMSVRLIALGLMFLLIRNSNNYDWYLLIIIFTALLNNGINMLRLRKSVMLNFKELNLKRHLKPLLLIFSTTIATSMYTMLDTVLLGFLSTTKAVGLYAAATKLAKIAIPIVTSLGMVLIPDLAKKLSQKNFTDTKATLDKSFSFTAFISIPMGVGLALLAPEFIIAFSSTEFLDAALCMQILAFLPLLIGYGYFFGFQILVPDGKDREMLYSVLSGMVAGLLLNFMLVPTLNHVGAAWANVLSEAVVTGFYMYYVSKNYSFRFSPKPLITAFCSSLSFAPIVILLRRMHLNQYEILLIAVPVCALLYTILQKLLFKEQLIEQTIEPYIKNKINGIRKNITLKIVQIYG